MKENDDRHKKLKRRYKMFQTTVEVDGMACSMCEAHINDTIRSEFPVEKVSSSHSKGRTVILSKEPLDEKALRAAIEGHRIPVGEICRSPTKRRDCSPS